jgi:quercetin dioxygenase-like cupin family protein
MKTTKLTQMKKGWFIGAFSPTAFRTQSCEVAVKCYRAGDKESSHTHLVATEITVVISGVVRMLDKEWSEGDILVLDPGDVTAFEAITDCATVVVKVPSVINDKYERPV